ncbi:MAG: neutral/alkaline non-lysosomal ceramidase N-terminal domain-containing protein [Planctomycetota bacterium]
MITGLLTSLALASGIAAGVARVDITPDLPIRLSGYGSRRAEATRVAQHLFARALALRHERDPPVLVIAVDACGVPGSLTDAVAARLAQQCGLERERFTLAVTHSHTAPCVADYLPTLFGEDLPAEHRAHIEAYSHALIDRLVQAGAQALQSWQPVRLAVARGSVAFAANRRAKDGPVDRSLPLLAVLGERAQPVAILTTYACHGTTLGGEDNEVCGDWAGYAAETIEQDLAGSVALVTIGCAGDANPQPRTGLELARQHGRAIAAEVTRLLAGEMTAVTSAPQCRLERIELPFAALPTEAQWQERARRAGAVGHHARHQLERLARGEPLPTALPYRVQTWAFGDQLAMVFLAGEVVVDYARRLQWEFAPARLWITAYANDVPCYIPSRRILAEGGYEAEDAMVYYDRPARLAPPVEDLVVAAVRAQLPRAFASAEARRGQPAPRSPQESLQAIRTRADVRVELVAAEPLIESPVAIDWSLDQKLYVCEMRDYPTGMDLCGKPGGRIKVLRDTDGDGVYDHATVFLDDLPFPTGVTAWQRGVLVCAAPDILYAEDQDGDDRADRREVLFTGFATDNFQARVNSLSLGLDHHVYGATGLLSASVRGRGGAPIALSNRDFRMRPDALVIEPAAGLSQQGRARDDWGNWFGCDSGTPVWQFPLPEHYLARNPHFAAPDPRVAVAADDDPTELHPISAPLSRFNDPLSLGRVTSACGLEIYRDDLLGAAFTGNAFVCEPVHNLVHRLRLEPRGVTFAGLRADDEQQAEFLASTDNWFRPVQARAGPDGALYIVDMYRLVIEHPRWIPSEMLAHLDVRAGAGMGRLYRVVPLQGTPRHLANLSQLETPALAAALDHQSGTWRDRIHAELLARHDRAATSVLAELATTSRNPACRVQALCVLDGLGTLTPAQVRRALADASAGVRSQALRLAERWLDQPADLLGAASRSPAIPARRCASSSRSRSAPLPIRAPARCSRSSAARDLDDVWLRSAVLSSATHCASEILERVVAACGDAAAVGEWVAPLVSTAAATGTEPALAAMLATLLPRDAAPMPRWQLQALAGMGDALARRGLEAPQLLSGDARRRLDAALAAARGILTDAATDPEARVAALELLAHDPDLIEQDLPAILALLSPEHPPAVPSAALRVLAGRREAIVADLLLARLRTLAPALRAQAQDALLARPAWTLRLLAALESHALEPGELDAAHVERLLAHADPAIGPRASGLFAAPDTDRKQVARQLAAAATQDGDPVRGAQVFEKLCASCHELCGRGHAVGPDLRALSDKSKPALLLAILDPNAAVDNRYVSYLVETRDGRSLTGIVAAETANSITLVQGGGLATTLLRADLQSMASSPRSLMPDGLEQGTTAAELADVIAFVQSSPRPLGSSSAEDERLARDRFVAQGTNGFARALAYQDLFQQPSWLGRVPMYYCRQSDGHGKVTWETVRVPAVIDPSTTQRFRLAAATGFRSQPEGKFALRVNGQQCLEFNVVVDDAAWQSPDGRVRMIYQVLQNNSEDSTGVLEIEVAASLLTPGEPVVFEVGGSAAGSQRWFGVLAVER